MQKLLAPSPIAFDFATWATPARCRKPRWVKGRAEHAPSFASAGRDEAPVALIERPKNNPERAFEYRFFDGRLWLAESEPVERLLRAKAEQMAFGKDWEWGARSRIQSLEEGAALLDQWASRFLVVEGALWRVAAEPCLCVFHVDFSGTQIRAFSGEPEGAFGGWEPKVFRVDEMDKAIAAAVALNEPNSRSARLERLLDGGDAARFEVLLPRALRREAGQFGLDCQGRPLLSRAARHGSAQAAELLLAAGADPLEGDKIGESALGLALFDGWDQGAADTMDRRRAAEGRRAIAAMIERSILSRALGSEAPRGPRRSMAL